MVNVQVVAISKRVGEVILVPFVTCIDVHDIADFTSKVAKGLEKSGASEGRRISASRAKSSKRFQGLESGTSLSSEVILPPNCGSRGRPTSKCTLKPPFKRFDSDTTLDVDLG
eukprot:CAMPEP_0181337972 /NCGR_PEP_ID=MMETSP1101-20121128/28358_1 /TAXON_ID=46948 /ORGANISM="Rhodomonas abbreviata, Strain Caron Lab Isolate" /LENGTH=112 /DNA_ID=CAMNT_0023448611 /DNA_START=323 /DNA_END=661 /DNA_ORIENTATION=+